MITIIDKHNCCGCSACAQRCPKQCITMQEDEEGFLYPQVDTATCVDCGLCEKVCPIFATKQSHEPLKVFAATNPDENVRKESSSGGIFSMLAEGIIRERGVVFGARWNKEWNVEHSYTEAIEGLKAFRSSKYVQSNINDSYQKAEEFLKEGRKVLFSGTPCQIAGLKSFLRKEYYNLLTVVCACHGIPSPKLWQKYLSEVSKGKVIAAINHRDKRTGWRNYSVVIQFANGKKKAQTHDDNPWTRAFIKNLTLRPSCHTCKIKIPHTNADLMIADLWGDTLLHPETAMEDKGITSIVVLSEKGLDVIKDLDVIKEFTFEQIRHYNSAMVEPAESSHLRNQFMRLMGEGKCFSKTVWNLTKDPFLLRMKIKIAKLLNK